jgi:small subunit ribosomal protein S4
MRKKWVTPKHPWDKDRIAEENKLLKEFGLSNKKEVWRARAHVRKYRHMARDLVGTAGEETEKAKAELVSKLQRLGVLGDKAGIDDVLGLRVEHFLDRRLQTFVRKKGMAKSYTQARQFITHGHISVNGRKVTVPSYLVKVAEEPGIGWYGEPMKVDVEPQPAPAAPAEQGGQNA